MTGDVVDLRLLCSDSVPLATGEFTRYRHFDYAATTPPLAAVWQAVGAAARGYGSVQRGVGATAASTSARFAAARATVGRFVGARPSDVVVFTRNTTDALTLLSCCLPAESHVVHLVSEHHANMLPWRRGRSVCLPIPVCVDDVPAVIETALRKLPPGPHLVAMTGASNVTGELLPVRAVSAAAHRVGARVVVDAAQLAGHSPLNMATLGADYLALSGHKMYAPFGSGVLVGRRDWLDAAEPYLPGGGAVVRVDAVGQTWAASPERHEGGTPNVLGAVALATAADALRDHGLGRLARREAALHVALRVGLGAVRGVRLLSMWDGPGVGICSFTVEGIAPALLAAALGAEYGIGVRVGAFCAQPLVSQLVGAETACSTSGPAAVRASVGVGTTVADVEFFLAAVESILTHGPACRYETDGVTWVPVQRSPQLHDELSTLAEPQVVDQTHAHADSR